ncbi:uroporphyrinogen-III C-methyltransferase [Acidipropionibacterium virtanenii]|uniref:uroporphyrinogen-III C-methyltransferase n=1 Tax=Acidipropionibacterium virtanenii TaxID=2057246 RepID=A0A344UWC8_9ACTN|nr:uroporphyrinogen-III C-methyltransferase [Acidipropionibacterium virtanenii]AXE39576.1 Uroporphyrinogen-III C-methyltransferase [Acidipropionibacterium virtanenii]
MTVPRYAPDLVPGTVTLVGGGPGDPGLLTLAGLQAVRQADVILYDRLAPLAVLEEAPEAEKIRVGKVPGGEYVPQERINELLVEHARAGEKVVRLKGGDSFVFGRGGEEWQACAAAGVPVRIIPGVTSSVAGPELAGIPLTHRHMVQGFTVVSGHVAPGDSRSELDWGRLAQCGTTLVILMGVAHIKQISSDLMGGGLAADTPVAVIRQASLPDQSVLTTTLAEVANAMAEAGVRPPAITVVGDVAGLDLDHTEAEERRPSDH